MFSNSLLVTEYMEQQETAERNIGERGEGYRRRQSRRGRWAGVAMPKIVGPGQQKNDPTEAAGYYRHSQGVRPRESVNVFVMDTFSTICT